MNAQRTSLGLFMVVAVLSTGCGDPEPVPLIVDFGFLWPIDAGLDLGPADAAVDLGRPLSDGGCFLGRTCDPARGCAEGLECQDEIGYSGGVYFQDGYCTNATLSSASSREGNRGACDPTPADDTPGMDGCPTCAKCISLGSDGLGGNVVQCYLRCTPAATTNPCRDGYTCELGTDVCVSACNSDEECQLYREDTNMNGVLEREGPDGGVSPDLVRRDVAGGATCARATTGRCTQPGTPGISAGATCVLDSECERDGRCLSDLSFPDWIGGYCTRFGCDVLGCASPGVCLDLGGGANLCASPCKLADDPGDAELGAIGGDDDCRTGYACFWDGVGTATDASNGGCMPGNYNAVTVPNIGASCAADDECWSPYGLGRCAFADASASCSILGCALLPAGACGAGSSCVSLSADSSMCLRDCTTAADCNADGGSSSYGCVDATGTGGATKHCFPGCQLDSDCDALYRCAGGSATSLGDCVRR